ncbi:MAG TPA: hypothetical protein PLJ21_07430 [Pseudobdellovibrionaceae bacterium]|nr:hypothetical protein [Pseudobdellovibrionaceae bacterium]
MTIEYVLLLTATVFLILKAFISAPTKAFANAGPRLGARIERHLVTGSGYPAVGQGAEWSAP